MIYIYISEHTFTPHVPIFSSHTHAIYLSVLNAIQAESCPSALEAFTFFQIHN